LHNTYDGMFHWGITRRGERAGLPQTAGLIESWRSFLGNDQHAIISVLDVGCGDGSLARALSASGFGHAFTLVDVSRAAIDHVTAHSFTGFVEAISCSADALPFDDQSFDLAVLSHVVEHLGNPLDALVEATRVAREVLVEVPLEDTLLSNARSWFRKHASGLPRSIGGVGHLHFFSKRTLACAVTQWNLIRIKKELQKLPPFHNPSHVRRFLAKLGVAFYGRLLPTHMLYLLERVQSEGDRPHRSASGPGPKNLTISHPPKGNESLR
jgi:SAM-dependent methyltransferase